MSESDVNGVATPEISAVAQNSQPEAVIPESAIRIYTTEGPPHQFCGYYLKSSDYSTGDNFSGHITVHAVGAKPTASGEPESIGSIHVNQSGEIDVRIKPTQTHEGFGFSLRNMSIGRDEVLDTSEEKGKVYKIARTIAENPKATRNNLIDWVTKIASTAGHSVG